jgi:hypothetical protein
MRHERGTNDDARLAYLERRAKVLIRNPGSCFPELFQGHWLMHCGLPGAGTFTW